MAHQQDEMKEPTIYRPAPSSSEDALSLLAVGSALLRYRRTIIVLALLGMGAGLAASLLARRIYSASATFIPEESSGDMTSGLALAASQFGIKVPTGDNGWGTPVYAELLKTRALLEPIAADTLQVPEEGGRRIAVMDLLKIKGSTPALRLERAVRALRRRVSVVEDKKLGGVRLSATTPWPSVSYMVASQLVSGVNQFNLESRKTQAGAERRFVETQALQAERELTEAENRLQDFLQRNRGIGIAGSPELSLMRERLQRDVSFRRESYSSLVKSREEAKISEVRNTPVITVIEQPRVPVLAEPRHTVGKTALGGLAGAVLGIAIAFLANGFAGARTAPSDEAREFFHLVDEATPRFLRRG
jgi:uncharacterized protein involved in exopolysaccharide biosynthesis